MSQPAEETDFERITAFYYGGVAKLGLVRGDTAMGYRTTKGILRCVLVQPPDETWTMERAKEHLELIELEIAKRQRDRL